MNYYAQRNNPVIRNILLVGSLVLLVKVVSFYKETIVSSTFGLSEFLDTFYIAILIPSFIQHVFIGALKNLFIPNYIMEMKTEKKLHNFQSFVVLTITIISIGLGLTVLLITDFFLEEIFPTHTDSYYALVRKQLYIILPCLILWGYSSFLGGLLEIKNKFLVSTVAMLIAPITMIFTIVLFKDYFKEITLVMGMFIGTIVGFTYLLLFSLKYDVIHLGKIAINENVRKMIKQYPPKVASGLLSGINPFVDQYFAAQLIVGSIASLNYGIKIPAFLVGIIMIALGNVLLPHFSKLVSENLETAFQSLFKTLKTVFFLSLFVASIIFIFSEDIIRLLFENGEFTTKDTGVVSTIQSIALVYVPFYICTLVCVKFLTATNKNHFMAWVSFWNLILNVILNIIFIKKYGVYGLILSTTIVYILSSLIYVIFTYRFSKKLNNYQT